MMSPPEALPISAELKGSRGEGMARVTQMVELHHDAVWRALRRLGVPERSLDDAIQGVFLVAIRKVETIRVGEERAYLMGIALRIASDVRRAVRRHGEVTEEDPSVPDAADGADELLDQKRARAALDEILGELPAELCEAFVLFELEGMTAPEVAVAMGIPTGTATSRLRRAREIFREKVARRAARKAK